MSSKKSTTTTAKPAKVVAPIVYAFIFYGGIIKTGFALVCVSSTHPEVEFSNYKKIYGKEISGSWVKCTLPIDTVRADIAAKLKDKEIADNLYKIGAAESKTIIKEATGAKQCARMEKTKKPDDKEEESGSGSGSGVGEGLGSGVG